MITTHFLAFMTESAPPQPPSALPALRLRRGGLSTGAFVLKSPASILDWAVEWSLGPGETIEDSIWTVEPVHPGGMNVISGSETIDGEATSCRIGGGVFRQIYTLTNTVSTSEGRVHQESMSFRIGPVELAL